MAPQQGHPPGARVSVDHRSQDYSFSTTVPSDDTDDNRSDSSPSSQFSHPHDGAEEASGRAHGLDNTPHVDDEEIDITNDSSTRPARGYAEIPTVIFPVSSGVFAGALSGDELPRTWSLSHGAAIVLDDSDENEVDGFDEHLTGRHSHEYHSHEHHDPSRRSDMHERYQGVNTQQPMFMHSPQQPDEYYATNPTARTFEHGTTTEQNFFNSEASSSSRDRHPQQMSHPHFDSLSRSRHDSAENHHSQEQTGGVEPHSLPAHEPVRHMAKQSDTAMPDVGRDELGRQGSGSSQDVHNAAHFERLADLHDEQDATLYISSTRRYSPLADSPPGYDDLDEIKEQSENRTPPATGRVAAVRKIFEEDDAHTQNVWTESNTSRRRQLASAPEDAHVVPDIETVAAFESKNLSQTTFGDDKLTTSADEDQEDNHMLHASGARADHMSTPLTETRPSDVTGQYGSLSSSEASDLQKVAPKDAATATVIATAVAGAREVTGNNTGVANIDNEHVQAVARASAPDQNSVAGHDISSQAHDNTSGEAAAELYSLYEGLDQEYIYVDKSTAQGDASTVQVDPRSTELPAHGTGSEAMDQSSHSGAPHAIQTDGVEYAQKRHGGAEINRAEQGLDVHQAEDADDPQINTGTATRPEPSSVPRGQMYVDHQGEERDGGSLELPDVQAIDSSGPRRVDMIVPDVCRSVPPPPDILFPEHTETSQSIHLASATSSSYPEGMSHSATLPRSDSVAAVRLESNPSAAEDSLRQVADDMSSPSKLCQEQAFLFEHPCMHTYAHGVVESQAEKRGEASATSKGQSSTTARGEGSARDNGTSVDADYLDDIATRRDASSNLPSAQVSSDIPISVSGTLGSDQVDLVDESRRGTSEFLFDPSKGLSDDEDDIIYEVRAYEPDIDGGSFGENEHSGSLSDSGSSDDELDADLVRGISEAKAFDVPELPGSGGERYSAREVSVEEETPWKKDRPEPSYELDPTHTLNGDEVASASTVKDSAEVHSKVGAVNPESEKSSRLDRDYAGSPSKRVDIAGFASENRYDPPELVISSTAHDEGDVQELGVSTFQKVASEITDSGGIHESRIGDSSVSVEPSNGEYNESMSAKFRDSLTDSHVQGGRGPFVIARESPRTAFHERPEIEKYPTPDSIGETNRISPQRSDAYVRDDNRGRDHESKRLAGQHASEMSTPAVVRTTFDPNELEHVSREGEMIYRDNEAVVRAPASSSSSRDSSECRDSAGSVSSREEYKTPDEDFESQEDVVAGKTADQAYGSEDEISSMEEHNDEFLRTSSAELYGATGAHRQREPPYGSKEFSLFGSDAKVEIYKRRLLQYADALQLLSAHAKQEILAAQRDRNDAVAVGVELRKENECLSESIEEMRKRIFSLESEKETLQSRMNATNTAMNRMVEELHFHRK